MPIGLYDPGLVARTTAPSSGPAVQQANLNIERDYLKRKEGENWGKAIQDVTTGALRVGKVWLDSARSADVIETTLRFQEELSAFRNEYTSTKRGKDALTAGDDFKSFASERLAALQQEANLDREGQLMLARSTGPMAVSFIDNGRSYSVQQEMAWKESTAKGAIASLSQFVAANYDNPALVEAQKDLVKGQLAQTFPGLDMTAQFAALDQQTTGDRIGSYIAAGQLGKAKQIFTENRALLGTRADEFAMKIANREEHNMRMALASEQKRYMQEERQRKALSNTVQKDVTDALIKNDFDKAQTLLAQARDVLDADDYSRLMTHSYRPPTASSDSKIAMRDLMEMRTSKDPGVQAAFPDAVNASYLAGDITASTRDHLTKTVYEEGDKLAMQQLDTFFGALTFDPTRHASLANAKYDYFLWSKDNPNSSQMERVSKSRELINTYSVFKIDSNPVWAQMSSYITKADLLSRRHAAVADAARKLNEDFSAGKITKQEHGSQAMRLQEIRRILDAEDSANGQVKGVK